MRLGDTLQACVALLRRQATLLRRVYVGVRRLNRSLSLPLTTLSLPCREGPGPCWLRPPWEWRPHHRACDGCGRRPCAARPQGTAPFLHRSDGPCTRDPDTLRRLAQPGLARAAAAATKPGRPGEWGDQGGSPPPPPPPPPRQSRGRPEDGPARSGPTGTASPSVPLVPHASRPFRARRNLPPPPTRRRCRHHRRRLRPPRCHSRRVGPHLGPHLLAWPGRREGGRGGGHGRARVKRLGACRRIGGTVREGE
jgi:hypothetical protein